MVTDYLQKTGGTCRYSYSKLKDVLYLVSSEHVKNVHIDNGEAYIDGLTELPLRINGFNIQFTEETSLDERYKFQKTLTLSMHGYVSYKAFGGRYYAIIESEDGTFFMVNVDFPSRITHTFNLSQNTNQTDFTFACLSNFPTLRLTNEFEAVSPVCLGLNVYGIDKLQLLEKENALLDVENRAVKTTESLKTVEFLGKTCSFQEVYDGNKVTDTITFNIAFDNYKPSWQWNLLEFLENKYVAIITPKGNDNKYYVGFNFGLSPSYTIQTSTEAGASDVITVTMVETSIYGSTAAVDWTDEQTTETQWRYIKNVGGTICYECIGLGRARYLVKQEVNAFGVPTGNYQVMEGYESEYPNFHIVGTFSDDVEFDNADCTSGDVCRIVTTIPQIISFSEATRHTYNLKTTCDWNITNIPDYISVSPTSGNANTNYEILVANLLTPTSTPVEGSMQINCCRQSRTINIKVQAPQSCISPITNYVNCEEQSVAFIYDGDCQIKVIGIDPQLTYTTQNNRLLVNIPKNDTYSAHTWNIGVSGCSCPSSGVSIHIVQDRIYDEWIDEGEYMCESGNSYAIERRYTATTYAATSYTRTNETRKGSLIQSGDTRCGTVLTKWEWDEESYYCIDGDKYKVIYEYNSYDGGTTWIKTDNTSIGDMVESGSSWCESAVTYSWRMTGEYDCSGYTSYYLYKKYETRDGNTIPCYPAIYSIDGDGSMSLIKKKDNDEGCGYVPPVTPLYRWVNLNISTDYICDDCSEPLKIKLTYSGGQTYSAECDSNTTLTTATTRPSGYDTSAMTSAIIGDCVTSIGSSAFRNCSGLTSITIPDSVTSIGDYAFNNCTSLTSVTIPDSVTSIGSSAFRNCSSLTSIVIPNSVTSIGSNAFASCSGLTSANIPTGLTSIPESLFDYDSNIEGTLEIPSGVTSIGSYAFWACVNLDALICIPVVPPTVGSAILGGGTSFPVYVPCESVDAYKSASGWSDYASRIQCVSPTPTGAKFSATYSGGQTYSAECDSNTTLTTATTRPSGYERSAMTSAVIGDCVTSIGENAFRDCSGLTSIDIPNSVTSIGNNAFDYCSGLTSVVIPNSVTSIGTQAFDWCVSLTSCTIGSGVTSIGNYAFGACTSLSSITIPDSVTSIGEGVFNSCGSLTSCMIGSGVTSIGASVFGYCPSLTSVTIKATTPPTLGEYAFYNANSAIIYVPCESVDAYKSASGWSQYATRIQAIPGSCFDGKFSATYSGGTSYSAVCDGNTSLTTATTKPSGYNYSAMTSAEIGNCVTSIGNDAFYDCGSLTGVTIPDSVTSIGDDAFTSCRGLTNINIPNSVTSISDDAFYDCGSLTSVTIPSGVTSISKNVFGECRNLTNVTIPNSVISIGDFAFNGCKGFTTIDIPSGVTEIGRYAFNRCSSLQGITVNALTPPTLGSGAFDDTNNCPIYVPAQSVQAYKSASGWSTYSSRITAIQ